MMGTLAQIGAFDRWLGTLPHPRKVVIAGNHDWGFERTPVKARSLLQHATYLEDELVTVDGVRIWGSPWQPWFYDWAFNLPRGPQIAAKWAMIPEGVDVLMTHGPPAGILDRTKNGEHVGCEDLRRELLRVRPKVHVFGHIHEGYGTLEQDGVRFVNASNCSERYRAVQAPIVFDL